jgi:divalent metal cation (Fe/Co/Zn/Cd) transporter
MKKAKLEDIVAHVLATAITLGFFAVILVSLLGYVDLKNPVVSSFLGLVVGYVAGLLNIILVRYFKHIEIINGMNRPGDKD